MTQASWWVPHLLGCRNWLGNDRVTHLRFSLETDIGTLGASRTGKDPASSFSMETRLDSVPPGSLASLAIPAHQEESQPPLRTASRITVAPASPAPLLPSGTALLFLVHGIRISRCHVAVTCVPISAGHQFYLATRGELIDPNERQAGVSVKKETRLFSAR